MNQTISDLIGYLGDDPCCYCVSTGSEHESPKLLAVAVQLQAYRVQNFYPHQPCAVFSEAPTQKEREGLKQWPQTVDPWEH